MKGLLLRFAMLALMFCLVAPAAMAADTEPATFTASLDSNTDAAVINATDQVDVAAFEVAATAPENLRAPAARHVAPAYRVAIGSGLQRKGVQAYAESG